MWPGAKYNLALLASAIFLVLPFLAECRVGDSCYYDSDCDDCEECYPPCDSFECPGSTRRPITCSDPCEYCDDGVCKTIPYCPCTTCDPCDECQICIDGVCVDDETCLCQPCRDDCEVCDDGICIPDETCPCKPCAGDCEICDDGECVPDDTCPCTPCEECEYCDDGRCREDRTCPCRPCDDCEICDDGECVDDESCPCNPCRECEICDDGQCVDDESCPCVPCGQCEICDDGECVEDRRCPDCKECQVYEMCVDGECLSLREAVGCPKCKECELCDPETAECVPDLTCPCVACRPMFHCVDGRCQSPEPLECPPCADCHKCDPFTGQCVPTCPCYPCQTSEECKFYPEANTSSSSATIFGVPPEECGYCMSQIPQPCATKCPNYWEVCDLRTGQCTPSCNIENACKSGEICFNELCVENKTCHNDCLSTRCYGCHPQTGWCERNQTCNPECKECSWSREECGQDGYCRARYPQTDPCTSLCGGGSCQRCDYNTGGQCNTCVNLGETCEESSGLCLLADIHCDATEEMTPIDVIVFYTRKARSYLSRDICEEERSSDVHIKRYIAQRFKETNDALACSCIKAHFRVVHVRQLPEDGFERIPCSSSRMCDDETDMIRGESLDSNYSLAKTFLRPFDGVFQSAFNITEDLVNDYGADVVVFLYEHSSDFKGGLALNSTDMLALNSKGKFMVPLRMSVPCEEDGDLTTRRRDAHQLFEFADQVGNLMIGSPEGVAQCSGGGPDPLPFHQTFCQRETRFGRLCADRMRTQIPVLSELGNGSRLNCASLLAQAGSLALKGDSICQEEKVTVKNALNHSIEIDLNSELCDWDDGDCCTADSTSACINPHNVSSICKDPVMSLN